MNILITRLLSLLKTPLNSDAGVRLPWEEGETQLLHCVLGFGVSAVLAWCGVPWASFISFLIWTLWEMRHTITGSEKLFTRIRDSMADLSCFGLGSLWWFSQDFAVGFLVAILWSGVLGILRGRLPEED